MPPAQNAFVILPFEDEFEDLYHDKIVPTLENHNYSVNKADSLATQRNIIEDIIDGITNADLIISDLTGANPNVFYELGIAHGLGIPTVLIAQDIGELPFDLSAYQTIEYSLRYDSIKEFEQELSNICESHQHGEIKFGSPVSDYAGVNIKQSHLENRSNDEKDSKSETDNKNSKSIDTEETVEIKGIIEYMAEVDKYRSEIDSIMNLISEKSDRVVDEIEDPVKKVINYREPEISIDRKEVNSSARDIALTLSDFSHFLSRRVDKFAIQINFLLDTVESIINNADASKQNERDILIELQDVVNKLISDIELNLQDVDSFREQLDKLTGVHRELDDSIKNLADSLNKFENHLQKGLAELERFESLIENKLEGD